MTAKDELRQYQSKVKDVDTIIEEYSKYLDRATKMTAVLSQMTARTNIPSDKVAENAAKMADLSVEYIDKWVEAERTRMKLVDEILKVGGKPGEILYDVYIEGLTLDQAAEKEGYAYTTAAHLHRGCFTIV